MLAFLAAIGSMMLKDSVNTVLVICEARGKARLAGGLAAVSDLAGILVTLAGAGAILASGWTVRTIGILIAMMVTSALGTVLWTKIGQRVVGGDQTPERMSLTAMDARIARLEKLQPYVRTD